MNFERAWTEAQAREVDERMIRLAGGAWFVPVRAIGDNVFVQKDPISHLEVGGILIPSMAERTPRFSPTILGTVVSAGARCRHVKAGDRVALKNVAGDDLFIRNQVLTHLRERDLVGLVIP